MAVSLGGSHHRVDNFNEFIRRVKATPEETADIMGEMERIHFATRYRLDNRDRYLIWFTAYEGEDVDGVVLAADGTLPIFNTTTELARYAENIGLDAVEYSDAASINLDVVAKWLKLKRMKRADRVDCVQFLGAWNLLADISKTAHGDFDPDQQLTQKIYLKIFWGNNLPAITPEGRYYVPLWSGRELAIMHEVMKPGLAMFHKLAKHP